MYSFDFICNKKKTDYNALLNHSIKTYEFELKLIQKEIG